MTRTGRPPGARVPDLRRSEQDLLETWPGGAPPSTRRTVLENEATWCYTTEQPHSTWTQPEFDDRAWSTGRAAFGAGDLPSGGVRNTHWSSPDIWLRRSFGYTRVDAASGLAPNGQPARTRVELRLRIKHDDDAEVFVNGVEVARLQAWRGEFFLLELENPAAVRPGTNTIAVH